MNLDIGRSVTYPFEDPYWPRKLIVFLIVGFVPGLNLILWSGYAVSVARNMARGLPPLPGWEDWSDIAVRGFLAIGAVALYSLPALIVFGLLSWVGALAGEGAFVALRCGGIVLAGAYLLLANLLLSVGHIHHARTDQSFHYTHIAARLRDFQQNPTLYGQHFAFQALLAFLLIMLTGVALALFLVTMSTIITEGGALALILIGVLTLGSLGFVAIVTLAFLANGYLLGVGVAAANRRQFGPPDPARQGL